MLRLLSVAEKSQFLATRAWARRLVRPERNLLPNGPRSRRCELGAFSRYFLAACHPLVVRR